MPSYRLFLETCLLPNYFSTMENTKYFGNVFKFFILIHNADTHNIHEKRDYSQCFWGKPTSNIDWCEENYAVTYLVAEFW